MDDVQDRVNELRGVFAGVLATDLDLVAIGHSTTELITRPLLGVRWQPGDRIVTFDEEYPAIRGNVAALAERAGLVVHTISLRDADGAPRDDDHIVREVAENLGAPTRVLLFSRVSWISGRLLPAQRMVEAARAAGVISMIDGAQSVGALRDDLDALDPDWLAFPSQKWLLGVEGLAGVRVSRRALDSDTFQPVIAGFLGYEQQPNDGRGATWGDARKFEMSGFSRPSLAGAARAAGWLSMQVGLPWAVERSQRLATAFYEAVQAHPGVQLLAPPGRHASIVSLRVAGWEADQLTEELGRRAFAITRRVPGLPATATQSASDAALRTSWGFWNTEEEVARIAELIHLLASHTPESLPKRPAIDIIQS
jgi:selenocysteine lyase/cysteine desulfurase